MYYRRKIILALLQVFGGRLDKINLQKLLFLVCQKQIEPAYDFIPYLYGSYSHSAKADLSAMLRKELLTEDETGYSLKEKNNYLASVDKQDEELLHQAFTLYGKMDAVALMKHTYTKFPYYAINSTTANRLLTKTQMERVNAVRPSSHDKTLFTIGYEGISLEAYLNKLILNDIKVLVDVRNNPLSQKFGFSKTQLMNYCKGLNIEYLHFPDVGIQSAYRRELKEQKDYDVLFHSYKLTTLPNAVGTQKKILALLKDKKRIALTCFEANICQCHRKPLAEALTVLKDWNYELKHI